MPGPNINTYEGFWVDHYSFLERRGYRLRPRYDPSHRPARPREKPCCLPNIFFQSEDEVEISQPCVLDAVRLADGKRIVLRKAATWKDEIPIYQSLSYASGDSRNRLVPILDIVLLPDTDEDVFIVMPFLRVYYDPPFSRVDQVVDCVSQFIGALQYLHERNVAHRDFCSHNLMMDASELIPDGHHFAVKSRAYNGEFGFTRRDRADVPPVKYFVIDLGLATRLIAHDYLVTGVFGQDKTVPELSWEVPYSPLMVDIYQLGHVIMKDLVDVYDGMEFLRPLAEMMTQRDPHSRPDIAQVVEIFTHAVSSLSSTTLQQPIHVEDWENRRLRFAPHPYPKERCCCYSC
ncbi:kinase-like domain-containing protein [Schizophyllum amplum]|uniref:Kinase-like domain-containing protein n=1 Tax=Schizophyllum amplum TaxID=97359 RepID=A0A550CXV3_9AGAR|nr:kinase-like domain-containing protein [Auriculariopsis ampla]